MMKPQSRRSGAFDPLNRLERSGLGLLLAGIIAFGVVTEIRSGGFLKRRMTDVDTYFRAAWAVRVHRDPYQVTDSNGWHYNYPPLLAILLYPLADAPAGASRAGLLPYPLSVAIWFILSVGFAWVGTCWLARAFEKTSPDPRVRDQPRYCRRWWALRIIPLLVCLPALGRALARGQVDVLLLLLLCAAGALLAYHRRLGAGFCIGLAAALKLFPGFLLLYAIWRGRPRIILGGVLALALGMIVVPVLVMGPHFTLAAYQRFNQVLIEPALGLNHNRSRGKELFDINRTDSNSFEAVLNNTLHIGALVKNQRPPAPTRPEKIAAWLIGLALLVVTLQLERRRRGYDAVGRNLFLGALTVLMLPMIPICHPHYFCLALPLVMVLLEARWRRDQTLPIGWPLGAVLGFFLLSHLLTVLPPFHLLRGLGLVTYGGLGLWLASLVMMWRYHDQPAPTALLEQRP